MKLDFYHWSYQCPLNFEMINLLSEYQTKIDISIIDITERPDIAKELKIFFPTLAVINHTHRFLARLKEAFLMRLSKTIYMQKSLMCQLREKKSLLIK